MQFDHFGITGLAIDYGMIILFTGSAALFFLYFWRAGKLNFEEDVKYQILKDEGYDEPPQRK